jgi:hypothetical protein
MGIVNKRVPLKIAFLEGNLVFRGSNLKRCVLAKNSQVRQA